MYHVSSMLPYNEKDTQHLERKRHLGNDIVVIVFQDDAEVPFQMASLSSHQNHVIVVITPHKEGYQYYFLKLMRV
jgi:RAP1 GTPase activating protein 1